MLEQIETEFRLGPRTILQPGDRFSVGGGPTHHGHKVGERGVFVFLRAVRKGVRAWVEGRNAAGALYRLYVQGPAFTPSDFPSSYRVKRYRIRKRRQKATA